MSSVTYKKYLVTSHQSRVTYKKYLHDQFNNIQKIPGHEVKGNVRAKETLNFKILL